MNDSHKSPAVTDARLAKDMNVAVARGLGGSIVILKGSIWRGPTVNSTEEPRGSIPLAYIWRQANPVIDLPSWMPRETFGCISPPVEYVLAI